MCSPSGRSREPSSDLLLLVRSSCLVATLETAPFRALQHSVYGRFELLASEMGSAAPSVS
jgi:hypothetical protein